MSTYTYDPKESEGGQGQVATTQQGGQGGGDINNLLLYQIKGKPAFAYADLHLKPQQRVVTDGNHMLWMDRNIGSPTTECWGGCWNTFTRKLSKESCCYNTYTNTSDKQAKLAVGYNDPGDILSFGVAEGAGWILTQNAFIAGTDNLDIRGKCPGCCGVGSAIGDEGFVITHVRMKEEAGKNGEQGVFVAGGYGAIVRHDIPAQRVLFVSKGLFFAAHESTQFRLGLAGGLKNLCCSGGAIVMKFHGPAVVYTQSRNPETWNPAKARPKSKKKKRNQMHG